MARPKPRSFAPNGSTPAGSTPTGSAAKGSPPAGSAPTGSTADGQVDATAGDLGQSATAANSNRQSRRGNGGRVGQAKAAERRLVPAGKSNAAESASNKASESGARGFSPAVSSAGLVKPGQPSTGRSRGAEPGGTLGGGTSPRGAKRVGKGSRSKGSQVIPEAVAQRMMRRIAIGTGVPSILGMAVFVGSYVLVSRHIFDVPPVATLLASGACFLLGVVGLSYGVLSASWEDSPGTWLGTEQLGVNISRVRSSLRAMRQGGTPPPAS